MKSNRYTAASGFTLIELLIVVLILAILAAVALPNLLEFQTRAKTARARADMRSIATALEAYAVEHNDFPPNGEYGTLSFHITTPISYISTNYLIDPFADKEYDVFYGELRQRYTYTKVVTEDEFWSLFWSAQPLPGAEAVDSDSSWGNYNPGAFDRYGCWRLVSMGPDTEYEDASIPAGPFNINPLGLNGSDIPYDPTNGTVSFGNILRFQNHPEGIVPAH